AEAAVDCGRHAEAQEIVRTLETVAVITPSPLLRVNLVYAQAVLAVEDEQEDRFRVALTHDLTRWPWPRARLQYAYGRHLDRVGRRPEAEVQLRAAWEVFDRIGAARWRELAASALAD